MKELTCTWVPGTMDRVRLKYDEHCLEIPSTRLTKIFGLTALNDLYLKGRVILRAEARQLSSLA